MLKGDVSFPTVLLATQEYCPERDGLVLLISTVKLVSIKPFSSVFLLTDELLYAMAGNSRDTLGEGTPVALHVIDKLSPLTAINSPPSIDTVGLTNKVILQ